MDGKVRVLVFEMTGSDATLQEALRVAGKAIGTGTDSLTVPARPDVAEANAPDGGTAPGRAELAAAHVARRAKAQLRGAKTELDCLPAGRGSGTPSPVQDLCLAALAVRPFNSSGVHVWAEKKSGKTIPIGSIYGCLSTLKKKGVVKSGDDADGNRIWSLAG
jgi:hypothetical protein